MAALEAADGEATFLREEIATDGGGLSRPRVLADGPVIEKAAVQFTHSVESLPPAATERHPHLAGRGLAPYPSLSIRETPMRPPRT